MIDAFHRVVENHQRIWVAARGPSSTALRSFPTAKDAVFVVDKTYAIKDAFEGEPAVVLIGDQSKAMEIAAERYYNTVQEDKPLLCFTYIDPDAKKMAQDIFGDTPIPLLPILEKKGFYTYQGTPYPTSGVMLSMLAASLNMDVFLSGIDLYSHPSGNQYTEGVIPAVHEEVWPSRHSLDTDMSCLKKVHRHLGGRLTGHCVAAERLRLNDPYRNHQ